MVRCGLALLLACAGSVLAEVEGYPVGVEARTYLSSADGTEQPTLFWKPADDAGGVPLLVALHTWSSGYDQQGSQPAYTRWCQQVGWAFVHPHFRGRNRTPEAMGSDFVVQDILDAVKFAKENANVDESRIYLMGGSGGGHASLLMAGRAPDVWAGVSAWCPITDIAAWHAQCSANEAFARYAREIEQALGGPPLEAGDRSAEATKRSPITHLAAASGVPLDINHGINDGRGGSVPFTHSLQAWNVLASDEARLSEDLIERFYETQIPSTPFSGTDSLYGQRQPVFRLTDNNVRLTIFNGGHEIIHNAGLNWLAAQRKGQPAVWDVPTVVDFDREGRESASGK